MTKKMYVPVEPTCALITKINRIIFELAILL